MTNDPLLEGTLTMHTDVGQAVATQLDRPPTVEDLMARAIERGDTTTMEKLFEMRREMRREAAEEAFNSALNAAQGEIRHIAANADNPQTKSRYATYDALDRIIRPVYIKNGFSISFDTEPSPMPDFMVVRADVAHNGGFTKSYRTPICIDGKGAKGGDVMTKTHAVGGGQSYGMRYLLKMIFNVAIGEDDTDGNTQEQDYERITATQAADLNALLDEVRADKVEFLKWAKIDKVENIRATELKRCITFTEAKRRFAEAKRK